ncbi:MAG: hypothetical protein F6J87_15660 [Spirulina sp. SIO3F2]|nr:hypothetical protein [Spirulina sp. SIO3F2]
MLRTLALDLEGTLISNAVSQIPRPGLYEFLEFAGKTCDRLLIYTAVNEVRCRQIAATLNRQNHVPAWFPELDYVDWQGSYKDLRLIPNVDLATTMLLDDRADYIHPGQEAYWLAIPGFDYPYSSQDDELSKVSQIIRDLNSVDA